MTPLELRSQRNEMKAGQIIKKLAARNMTGYYASNREEALKIALSLIPEGSTVAQGGSMTVSEIGLRQALKDGNYDYLDREAARTPEDKKRIEERAFTADVFIGSVNAISEDGILVNIDGNSNRVSAYAYGPKKLVLVAGMNKVAADFDAALKRARNEAATINAQRFGLSTPCSKTGTCMNCLSPDTICCQFLITRFSKHKGRIHVILVNDNLGF
ncbi:MAG: lactate utilization protein [Clostridiales bacterium]|nr:lactate utilization protein [Clostridiales bacterium]